MKEMLPLVLLFATILVRPVLSIASLPRAFAPLAEALWTALLLR
jgi:hypothetical protein